ncbi:helix-turn-helix domain-containing protein (plasmid) [Streptomyces sp. CWNU-52B]|uniref:helix-turn-helix domain-containing protein n=1 Tax=unclassified Streptomyces TaxID=2593676 RepID=UPI0039C282C1
MAAQKQHINPDVLVWAMKQSGMSRSRLADELDTDPVTIDGWMTGDEFPSLTELKQLAKALRRPTSLFFMSRVPTQQPVQTAFRKPIGSKGVRNLSIEERAEIRSAQRRQKIAVWAAERVEEHLPVRMPTRHKSPEAAAQRIQTWLQWDVAIQVKSSKSAVTRLVRRSLEDQGVMIIQLSMNSDACRGFSIYSDTVPLIAYNSTSHVAAARTFTILHELGHLLSHEQAVCDQPDDAEERWCDRFAAAFLIPESHLRAYMAKYLKVAFVENDDLESVRKISNRYGASFQCVALRLIDLKIANWPLYRAVSSSPLEIDGPAFGGEPQTTDLVRMREYGVTYPRLLLAARDRGKLHDLDARKYLNVNGEQLRRLQQRIAEEV